LSEETEVKVEGQISVGNKQVKFERQKIRKRKLREGK